MNPLHSEHDLLQAYLDGALSPEEAGRLEVRLAADSELADALILLAREEAIGTEWAKAAAATQCEDQASIQTTLSRAGHRRFRRIAVVSATAAAIVIFALLAMQLTRRGDDGSQGPVVALLEDVQGTVEVLTSAGAVTAQVGQPLYSGQEIRTGEDGSSTVVRVQDSRLVLSAETHIRLEPEGRPVGKPWPVVYVMEGIVGAEIAARADGKPMVLSGSHAEVRGQSGKYQFVSLPETTVLETSAGSARFTRKSDGQSIMVPRGKSATASLDAGPLQAHNLPEQPMPRRMLSDGGGVQGLLFDPESLFLTSCAGDAVKRWDLQTGKSTLVVRPQKSRKLRTFAAAPDGQSFALTVADDKAVRVYSAGATAERTTLKGLKRVAAVAFSADGRSVAVSWNAGKEGNEVRLYDTHLGVERVLYTGHAGAVQALAFSPRGAYLATAGDRTVKVWEANHLNHVRSLAKLPAEARVLAFSPDDRLLAFGDRKGHIRLVDPQTGSEKQLLTGHLRDVVSLAFSPDGLLLASGGADGTARLWNVADGREILAFRSHAQTVSAVAFSRDGRTMATGGQDRKIMLWDVPNLFTR